MKSKIFAVVMAAMLMLALPALAWANPSAEASEVVLGDNGTALSISGTAHVKTVAPTSEKASNVPAGTDVLASYEITGTMEKGQTLNLTFMVGTQYAGYTVYVYIQHNDGATEVKTATVGADGTITISVDKLSIFSLVLGEAGAGTVPGAGADNGSTSPKTGVDMTGVAAGTVAAIAAAGAVTVALRRKTNE